MFKCIFLNENVWITIIISLKFVPKGSINNNPALFQIMAWPRPGFRFADGISNAFSWMKIALITISLKYVPRGPGSIKSAFVQIMTWHRTGDKPLSESIPPKLLTHIYVSLDHNAWVPAGCLTLSWTKADLSPRNEHELDPNLCVFIEQYAISKPVCGHWIYPLQIESKQTLFYVPWTVKDRTHTVRVPSIKKWLC